MILRIDEIAVSPRGAGVPDFDRDRMVSVLDTIRRDGTLPPIEVVEAISDAYSHRLHDGRHRLAASIAVGFFLVPAVVVRDLDEIKRAEGHGRVPPEPRSKVRRVRLNSQTCHTPRPLRGDAIQPVASVVGAKWCVKHTRAYRIRAIIALQVGATSWASSWL
jgi:hypothetical protein